MEPKQALVEAVRRLDPAFFNPNAMVPAFRGDSKKKIPEKVAAVLWPTTATKTAGPAAKTMSARTHFRFLRQVDLRVD